MQYAVSKCCLILENRPDASWTIRFVNPAPIANHAGGFSPCASSVPLPQCGIDNGLHIVYYVDIMAKGEYLGEFEHIVLLTILRLGDGAYGAMIRAEIERVTGRSPAIGTVHATLDRLERKELVSSWTGEPTAERGGKAKRHFKVEADGVAALKNAQKTLERLHAGVSLRNVIA